MTGQFLYVPEAVAVKPAEGRCLVNRWWAVHPERGVAFYAQLFGYTRSEEPSPQCNSNEHVARHLTAKLQPDCEVKLLPTVFLAHAQREFERLRRAAQTDTRGDGG